MYQYTYEQSVQWMRSQPELSELVEQCYLDEDNLAAARRFAASEEFAEVTGLLKLNGTPSPRLKILDVGCGNGIASYAFAALGHDVCAMDPDDSADVGLGAAARLASAVTARGGTIATCRSPVESIPFADATFDVVYTRQAVHHFGDLRAGLAECARVLKRNGLLLATREHVVDDEEQLRAFFAEHILHKLHGGENAYPLNGYLSALGAAGFNVLRQFAPFDTVINHFPASNAQVRDQCRQGLTRKFGGWGASALLRLPRVEQLYRRRLSGYCHSPGRLYSFLCSKEQK